MRKSPIAATLLLFALGAAAQENTNKAFLNINNINTSVYPLGYLGYNGNGTEFLVGGTQSSTLFANGLWIGDSVHVAIRKFGSQGDDYYPGPLTRDGSRHPNPEAYDRVWHVTRSMIDNHLAHYTDPGYAPAESILTWPAEDSLAGHPLAPYYDADGDGHYNPMNGDHPLIRGDEAIFSIFNDVGSHGESGGEALGIEIHCMTYAFATSNEPSDTALQNTIFIHYDIFNRSANTYRDVYVGMWSDLDIGNGQDDYVGCDVGRSMYFGYNGQEEDYLSANSFTGVPPAQGCIILAGPWQEADGIDNASAADAGWQLIPGDTAHNQAINGWGFGNGIADDERMGMTNFTYFQNSFSGINSHPQTAADHHNLMRSVWRNGQHVTFGDLGVNPSAIPCTFTFPGDSDPWHWGTNGEEPEGGEWTEEVSEGNQPGDRRGVGSSGPFTFAPSAQSRHQQLDVAYVTGWGQTSVQQSVDALKRHATSIRRQFANDTTASGRPFAYRPLDSQPAGIGDVKAEYSIAINGHTISVFLPNAQASVPVAVHDVLGRRIAHATTNTTIRIAVPRAGVYIVNVGDLPAQKVVVTP